MLRFDMLEQNWAIFDGTFSMVDFVNNFGDLKILLKIIPFWTLLEKLTDLKSLIS